MARQRRYAQNVVAAFSQEGFAELSNNDLRVQLKTGATRLCKDRRLHSRVYGRPQRDPAWRGGSGDVLETGLIVARHNNDHLSSSLIVLAESY